MLDELGIKKCSILGSLTGGYIAGEVAVSYRERLNKLILCNVHGFDAEEAEKIDGWQQLDEAKRDLAYLDEKFLSA